jgi:hypothetical protein
VIFTGGSTALTALQQATAGIGIPFTQALYDTWKPTGMARDTNDTKNLGGEIRVKQQRR